MIAKSSGLSVFIASAILISSLAGATPGRKGPRKGTYDPPPLNPPAEQAQAPDPLLRKAWHLEHIGAFKAWRETQGDPRVSIAVIDSGINYNHPDLNPNLRRKMKEWPPNGEDKDGNGFIDDVIGWDFVRNFYLPWDRTGHGTFVAGVAAAALDNGVGSAGVCPKCSILPIRFMNKDGMGWDEDGLASIKYAVKENAAVINLSFAGEGYDRDYHYALRKALERDIVVVVAAGNDAENIDHSSIYPPKFQGLPNMIVVAATDRKDTLVIDKDSKVGSNWSSNFVHIAAPGEEILGPWNDDTYQELDGTSYAAPIVAGAAGLIRSANLHLSAPQIVKILIATARKARPLENKIVSGGVLDLEAAIHCAKSPKLDCLDKSLLN